LHIQVPSEYNLPTQLKSRLDIGFGKR